MQAEIKSQSIATKLYIDALLNTKLDINMREDLDVNRLKILNVRNPIDPLDAVNKMYVQIATQKDDLTIEKLIKTGDVMF